MAQGDPSNTNIGSYILPFSFSFSQGECLQLKAQTIRLELRLAMCGSHNPHTVPLQGPSGIFNGPVGINCGVKTVPCASMVKSPCALGQPQVSQCEASSEALSPDALSRKSKSPEGGGGGGGDGSSGGGGGSGNSGHIKSDSYDLRNNDPAVPGKETTSGGGSGDEGDGADEVRGRDGVVLCSGVLCPLIQCSASPS